MAKDNKPTDGVNTPEDEKAAKNARKEAEKAAEKAKKERIKQSKPKKKESIFSRAGKAIVKFFKDFRGTAKKITWPDRKTVIRNTGTVLLSILIFGAAVWIIDFLLSQGVSRSTDIIEGLKNREELSETADEEQTVLDTDTLSNDELLTEAQSLADEG
ncbi:MAG: preprotein translocase subunit SecE [Clostridia bacterium]|nr:preprotein translocase subunit SecE [Clostridia bacterium]